jgi:hypothetical protein
LFTDEYSEIEQNAQRADWARVAVVEFAKQTRQVSEAGCLEDPDCFYEVVGDLIADMGHLADVYGHNAEYAVFRGRGHYEEECAEAAREVRDEVASVMAELRTALAALTEQTSDLGRIVAADPTLSCVVQTAAELDEVAGVLVDTAELAAEANPSFKGLTTGAGALADAVAVITAATGPTRKAAAG